MEVGHNDAAMWRAEAQKWQRIAELTSRQNAPEGQQAAERCANERIADALEKLVTLLESGDTTVRILQRN